MLERNKAFPLQNHPGRLAWVDAARGVGIILVVLGHALGGLIDAETPHAGDLRALFFIIYIFHMPFFFILSGLFVSARIERQSTSFPRAVLTTLVWPCVLWSVVQLTTIEFAASVVNVPVDNYWRSLVLLPVKPISQFWFFYALLLLHGLAYLLLGRIGPLGLLVVATGLCSLATQNFLPTFLTDTCTMAPFYAIGVGIGASGLARRPLVPRDVWAVATLTVLALGSLVLAAAHAPWRSGAAASPLRAPDIAHLAFGFPNVFAALLTSLALGCLIALAGERIGRVLPYIGRHSLSVYVLHVMFVAGTRIVLVKVIGLREPVLFIPILVLIGVAAPLLVYEIARRWRLQTLLGLS